MSTTPDAKDGKDKSGFRANGPAWLGGIAAILTAIATVVGVFIARSNDDGSGRTGPDDTAVVIPESEPVIDTVQVSPLKNGTLLDVAGHGWVETDEFLLHVIARPPGDDSGDWQNSPAANGRPDGTWRTSFIVRPGDITYQLLAVLVHVVRPSVGTGSTGPDDGTGQTFTTQPSTGSPSPDVGIDPDDSDVVYVSDPELVDA